MNKFRQKRWQKAYDQYKDEKLEYYSRWGYTDFTVRKLNDQAFQILELFEKNNFLKTKDKKAIVQYFFTLDVDWKSERTPLGSINDITVRNDIPNLHEVAEMIKAELADKESGIDREKAKNFLAEIDKIAQQEGGKDEWKKVAEKKKKIKEETERREREDFEDRVNKEIDRQEEKFAEEEAKERSRE